MKFCFWQIDNKHLNVKGDKCNLILWIVSIPHFFIIFSITFLYPRVMSVNFADVCWGLQNGGSLHWPHPAPGWSLGTGAGAPCIADTWAESQEPRNPGPEWRDGSFKVRTPDVTLSASLTYPRSRCSEEQKSFFQNIDTNICYWPILW